MTIDDTVITTHAKMALATDERTGLLDVEVETIDGVVYLRGQVESEVDRVAASQVASQVAGVRQVLNEMSLIHLRPPTNRRVDLPKDRPFAREENSQ